MHICLIPARGGSKRIHKKNIKLFNGKPIIHWSIHTALQAECFDKVIVSTDDPEIAEVSLRAGASVPFTRPAHLADDYATTQQVVQHAISWFYQQQWKLDSVCCLYPTSPLSMPQDLIYAKKILSDSALVNFIVSITSFGYPIQRAIRVDESLKVSFYDAQFVTSRSQDLEPMYHDAGQFYWGLPTAWMTSDNLFTNSHALILPSWRVQDIDTEDDWKRAEIIHSYLNKFSS